MKNFSRTSLRRRGSANRATYFLAMGLIFVDRLEDLEESRSSVAGAEVNDGEHAALAREAFLAGVKAALVVQRLQTYGEVWCSGCGSTWADLHDALLNLELRSLRNSGRSYRHREEWGDDHPANLVITCSGCRSE